MLPLKKPFLVAKTDAIVNELDEKFVGTVIEIEEIDDTDYSQI